ncbi:MAG: PEP-CTERM sorting domain-containing protein, partial [Planctomycetia bacterium]|nr:PEP-CTERM sorting domain-containing protein [Planctomycetia bacterium]
GYGSLAISDGATVSANDTSIAAHAGGAGTATIAGNGSVWNNSGQFDVGWDGGSGSLTVSSNATLNVGGTLAVWQNSRLTIDGGIVNTQSFSLVSGGELDFRDGTLTVNGGTFNPGGVVDFSLDGDSATALPTLRLVGGATMASIDELIVGGTHRGAMEIRGASALSSGYGAIGAQVDSAGVVTVADPGSSWEIGGWLTIGGSGSGVLNVLNGADVSTPYVYLGAISGASAAVTVSGTNARLDAVDALYVGGLDGMPGGTAVLNIQTGGTVDTGILEIWGPGTVNLDGGALSVGQLSIDGGVLNFNAGTLAIHNMILTVGAGGPLGSSLELSSGQHITVDMASSIASTGRLCVGGGVSFHAGTLTNQGELQLAGHTARVSASQILNYGLIHGSGRLDGPLANTAGGQVRVDTGDWIIVSAANSENSGTINLEGGTLEFTGSLYNYEGGFISGRGTLRAAGGLTNEGVLTLSGGFSDVYGDVTNDETTSKIVITGGGLTTFYDDVHSDGTIRISAGCAAVFLGELSGSGGISGTGTAYIEDDLRPGNSPAVVAFGGDLVFSDAATLESELAGTDPGDDDGIEAAGDLALAGTLDVRLLDSFMPSLGDTFDILDWSSLAGTFDAILLPELAASLKWDTDDLYVSGELAVIPAVRIPGDANDDGFVNDKDASIVGAHWMTGDAAWEDGDFNDDNVVNDKDAAILAAHWGETTPPGSGVPEPSTIVLLLCALAALAVMRRRRTR